MFSFDLQYVLCVADLQVLCGTSNYRQLLPTNVSNVNRSVVLAVTPKKIFWAVIQCTWNCFTIEALGLSDSHLAVHHTFKSLENVNFMLRQLDQQLITALTDMSESANHSPVERIKCIVKQLRDNEGHGLTSRKAAGALTNSTVAMARQICDDAATTDSVLVTKTTKVHGSSYIRTLPSGRKFEVIRSTGQHFS